MRWVSAAVGEVEYVRLQHEQLARKVRVTRLGDFELQRYTKIPHCAMCYAITPRIAERLLSMSREFRAPVDIVMKLVFNFARSDRSVREFCLDLVRTGPKRS